MGLLFIFVVCFALFYCFVLEAILSCGSLSLNAQPSYVKLVCRGESISIKSSGCLLGELLQRYVWQQAGSKGLSCSLATDSADLWASWAEPGFAPGLEWRCGHPSLQSAKLFRENQCIFTWYASFSKLFPGTQFWHIWGLFWLQVQNLLNLVACGVPGHFPHTLLWYSSRLRSPFWTFLRTTRNSF